MNVPKLRFREFTGEWKEKSFRDIVSLNLVPTEKPSSDYVRLGIRSHCKGTFHELVKIENVLEADKMFLVPKDNLILNITFAWEHAIAITDENDEGKYVSGRFPTFSFKSEELPAFYESIIRSKRMKYELGVASPGGAGRNRVLNKELFLDIPVNTTNIEEQTKISNFIRCVDDKIKNQKDIIESLEKQKKGLMQKIFSQELRFKDEDGKEFPAWEEKKLGDVIELNRGSSPRPIEQFITHSDDGVPWIRIGDVPQDGNIIEKTSEKITREGAKKSRLVKKGELILSNSMSFGKPYILGFDGYIHDGWFVLRNYGECFTTEFLNYMLCSEKVQKQYQKLAAGGVVNNISSSIVNSVALTIPSLKEQVKIVEFLQCVDEKINSQTETLNHWQRIKKGLLQQMFV